MTVNGRTPMATVTTLSAHGSRVRTALSTPTPAAKTAVARTAAPVAPTATIHTMILLLPDEFPQAPFTATALDRHFGVRSTLQARFWATPTLRPWHRHHLISLRKGTPAYCAGGPARLLDLTGLRQATGVGAGIRHQIWTDAVRGTRPAYPWHQYLSKHYTEPDRYSWDTASRDFHAQPRITAMRMHNAVNPAAGHLDLAEVEMYQAGQMAYQHYSAATAICADALLDQDGVRLAPASDALADRTTYIERALHTLDRIDDQRRLVAVSL
jgi:hypothetical protein